MSAAGADCGGACPVGDAMSRRAFMERAALAALGAVAAGAATACGDGQFGPVAVPNATLPAGTGGSFRVADFPALASVGGIAATTLNGVPLAIGRTGAATYVVWSLVCPHQGQQVVVSGAGFRCPGHGATWNGSGGWTGGQATGSLAVVPSTFDAASGTVALAGAGPSVEQDFTVDLAAPANAALAAAGGWIAVTRPIPNSTRTTRIYVARLSETQFAAYGAACGHQGKYVAYDTVLRHWRCPEHGAEFAMDGAKLRNAQEDTNVPTGNLVGLTVSVAGTTLRIRGNSPPQGNP